MSNQNLITHRLNSNVIKSSGVKAALLALSFTCFASLTTTPVFAQTVPSVSMLGTLVDYDTEADAIGNTLALGLDDCRPLLSHDLIPHFPVGWRKTMQPPERLLRFDERGNMIYCYDTQ
ncbi:MAG: hypothetical protein ACK502_03335 [Alphaproteobacteria bacterium]